MKSIKLQTIFEPRDRSDDRLLFLELRALLLSALQKKQAAPMALMARRERLDLLPLSVLNEQRWPLARLMSALTQSVVDGSSDVIAVGLIGVFNARRSSGESQPEGLLFLEWSDCHWVQWSVGLEGEWELRVGEGARLLRAVDGAAKPLGLGGWWSAGRRHPHTFELNSVVH